MAPVPPDTADNAGSSPTEARPSSARRLARGLVLGVAGVVAFLVLGNAVILGASLWARQSGAEQDTPAVDGVRNLRMVDAELWRGAAPSMAGYRSLAAQGVTRIVDLRAEDSVAENQAALAGLGLDYVRIPIRDGQTPSADEVHRFLAAVEGADGLAFVHCGAGVGRAGTMAAAYRVAVGGSDGMDAMWSNLSVGPPSLEQLAFAASLDGEGTAEPPASVVATSRLLDAPRRIWHNLGL